MKTIFLAITIMCVLSIAPGYSGDKATAVIIDVRDASEWSTGHLEGAMLIPHERIVQDIKNVTGDKKTKIYLYCRTGRRSGLALDALKRAGYEDPVNLGTIDDASKTLKRQIVK